MIAYPWSRPRTPSFWLLLASLTGLAPCLSATGPDRAELTTAAEVRALSVDEARRGVPVHLKGVFLGSADPEGIAFVVQDETEGIYVQGPPELVAGLGRGDLLDIEGITDPGGFAPFVVAKSLHRIGKGLIPEPIKVSLDELNAGRMDAKWVEITGIVRSVEPKQATDSAPPPPGTRYTAPSAAMQLPEPKVKMKLASGSARVVVELSGALKPEDCVDAEVRIRGLCFNLHNRNRQFVRPFVQVPRGVEMVVEVPPPAKPFDGPPRPVASLLRFEQLTGKHGHRVHIRGTVIHHQPGSTLWVRDQDYSLRIETAQAEVLHPGDEVDVAGFPARGEYSAVLEDGVFRKRSTQPAPQPNVLANISDALRNDANLVELEARVSDVRRFPDSVVLLLDWHQTSVRAQMLLPENVPVPADWQPGTVARVSGVCSVITDGAGPLGGLWEPRAFQLLLRSPADFSVIQPPPWWNAERVVWVLSGFLALAVCAVGVVMLASRRRLKDQEHRRAMAEAEFTAILSERNRVAREIHDTLSQSLGAISVQLELARTHAAEISAPARHHLGSAHKLARAALAEARDSIWNMRSQVLEKGDLGEALEGILVQMTEDTEVKPSVRVEGDRRRLPPVVENNLLRIGQEAITNACKHAKPTRIDVALAFEGRTVRLAVEDDGVGFTIGSQPNGKRRSFGLVGIQERVELLGGKVEITSAPGEGTRVVVAVPV
ncbi:two-component sensor histidine kinase [Opitutaceae bacterium EW11]|nr:two-component sensor histidine kinase [Opitutaceae bacterium EW11]